MSNYYRDPETKALINANSNGYAARIAAKKRYAKIEAQETEIETLKTQIASLQAAVDALTPSE